MEITYFVHGTTTDNEKGLATGWVQGTLSQKGIEQTIELSKLIKNNHFDMVFCSDLDQAIESSFLLFGNKHIIVQDKRLREANYGDFTEKPAKSFKNNLVDYIHTPFPNGESYLDIEKRIHDFLFFLREKHPNQSVAIVAHQAPQLALEVLTKNKTWEQAMQEDWRHSKAWKAGWTYSFCLAD